MRMTALSFIEISMWCKQNNVKRWQNYNKWYLSAIYRTWNTKAPPPSSLLFNSWNIGIAAEAIIAVADAWEWSIETLTHVYMNWKMIVLALHSISIRFPRVSPARVETLINEINNNNNVCTRFYAHLICYVVMCINIIDDYVEHELNRLSRWKVVSSAAQNAKAYWRKYISDSEIKTGIEYKPSC